MNITEIAAQLAEARKNAPTGYYVTHIQTPANWTFKISRGSWKTTNDNTTVLIADARAHAERIASRQAQAAAAPAPSTTIETTPAPASRRCACCGTAIAPGRGMIANMGLSCDNYACYDRLSD